MSIATDVSRIKGNIAAALAAIADKGVTVPDGSTSDALAELIASIEAGGGGINVAYGTVTLSEDSDSITINHGLGDYPTFAALIQTGVNIAYAMFMNVMFYTTKISSTSSYHWHNRVSYTTSSSSSGRRLFNKDNIGYPTAHVGSGYYCCHPSVNEVSFNKGDCNAYTAGLTYIWVALTGSDF